MKKIELIWRDLLNEFGVSTIKACSLDKRNDGTEIFLSESLKKAVNFDDVARDKADKLLQVQTPKSVDCLYLENGKLSLVEFKNKKRIEGREKENIKLKFHDTLVLLNYLYEFDRSDYSKIELILVKKRKEKQVIDEFERNMDLASKSSCPDWLKFIEKTYGIKISMMHQDEYSKRVG